MSPAKRDNSGDNTETVDNVEAQPRIVPLDRDLADRGMRPFQASAARKCYVIFDKGPPPVLTEVDSGDIVIVDQKMKFV